MKNRRGFLLTLTAGLVAGVVIITPVIAEELFAFVTNVDVDGKMVTIVPAKGEGDSVVLTITDKTEIVTGKGDTVDLEKLAKGVMKQKEAGKKGQFAKVAYDGKVASKITVGFAKKKEAN